MKSRVVIAILSVYLLGTGSLYGAPKILTEKLNSKNYQAEFLGPNEFRTDVYRDTLEGRKGVYVAVGTARIFNTLLWADFDEVIGIDYEVGATDFNKLLLNSFRSGGDRYEFLTKIFGKLSNAPIVEKVRKHKVTDQQFYNWLMSPDDFDPKSPKVFDWNGATAQEDYELIKEQFKSFFLEKITGIIDSYPVVSFSTKRSKGEEFLLNYSFLGSDAAYNRLTQKVNSTKFTFVTGNLVGTRSFSSVGKYLKSNKMPLSVIDVSNAFDYPMSKVGFKRFIATLKNMPRTSDAIILFTTIKGGQKKGVDNFTYMQMSVDEFINRGFPSNAEAEATKNKLAETEGAYTTLKAYDTSVYRLKQCRLILDKAFLN